MSQAVTIDRDIQVPQGSRRRVLITGAAGNIGTYFAQQNHERYDLRLAVHEEADRAKVASYGETVLADINDLASMQKACDGMDTVVHLAALASPMSDWPGLLKVNIIGTYNAFYAAFSAGCKRVIYASSIHAVSGYPADVQVKPTDPVNPGDLYGVSKCFGEALARYMAEQEGLSAIALRIGGFQPAEKARGDMGVSMLDAWVSQRDLDQLIRLCIEAPSIRFAIFNAISDNRFKRLDISSAREVLGYKPLDDSTQVNEELRDLNLAERVTAHNLGDPNMKSGLRDENVEVK